MLSSEEFWSGLRESIRRNATEAMWSAGLNALRLVDFQDNLLVIGVPNEIQKTRIQQRYLGFIAEQATALFGQEVEVSLTVSDLLLAEPYVEEFHNHADQPVVEIPVPRSERSIKLDPRMTFATFIEGPSNAFAAAAALAVAEIPGRSYNPLIIHGNSGLGKTHLLHAIGNYIQENYPERRVRYVTTETYLNDFLDAVRSKTQLAMHNRYREIDVFLIDDFQFMETRGPAFAEEVFHTYNALRDAGKQVVLTSDRSPRDLGWLDERFRTRLLQGLITEVDQPDLETRINILRSKSEAEGVNLPDDVVEWIARRVRDNIRELEGSITMLRAFSNLRQEPISLELAKNHLTNLGSEQIILKPETILKAVAEFYGLTVDEIRGSKRLRPLVHARHVAMYLFRDLLNNYSYPMIARVFDGRNHTTVISAVEKVKEQLPSDPVLLDEVNKLKRKLQGDTRD